MCWIRLNTVDKVSDRIKFPVEYNLKTFKIRVILISAPERENTFLLPDTSTA